jgi:hypothetical protein
MKCQPANPEQRMCVSEQCAKDFVNWKSCGYIIRKTLTRKGLNPQHSHCFMPRNPYLSEIASSF